MGSLLRALPALCCVAFILLARRLGLRPGGAVPPVSVPGTGLFTLSSPRSVGIDEADDLARSRVEGHLLRRGTLPYRLEIPPIPRTWSVTGQFLRPVN